MGLPYLGAQNILRRHHDTWPTFVEFDPVHLTSRYHGADLSIRCPAAKASVLSSFRSVVANAASVTSC